MKFLFTTELIAFVKLFKIFNNKTGNEIDDEEAKAALEDDLLAIEKYPPQDLINWIKTEKQKTRKARW
jgi:hypothetical protein